MRTDVWSRYCYGYNQTVNIRARLSKGQIISIFESATISGQSAVVTIQFKDYNAPPPPDSVFIPPVMCEEVSHKRVSEDPELNSLFEGFSTMLVAFHGLFSR
jgi:hypothetical protein